MRKVQIIFCIVHIKLISSLCALGEAVDKLSQEYINNSMMSNIDLFLQTRLG